MIVLAHASSTKAKFIIYCTFEENLTDSPTRDNFSLGKYLLNDALIEVSRGLARNQHI